MTHEEIAKLLDQWAEDPTGTPLSVSLTNDPDEDEDCPHLHVFDRCCEDCGVYLGREGDDEIPDDDPEVDYE